MDLSPLSSVVSTAGGLGGLILVTPNVNLGINAQLPSQPNNSTASLLSRFRTQNTTILFHYEEEQTVTMSNDITDHFVEDNTTLQDHIARKPLVITTNGFIGELNDIVPPALAPLKFLADKLIILAPYTPQLSVTALIAFNTAQQLYNTAQSLATSAVSSWNTITGGSTENKQQKVFNQFYGYWRSQDPETGKRISPVLFTVQTPFAIHKNMAIQSVRAIQDGDTRMISNFEVTFKEFNFATTSTAVQFQGRSQVQSTDPVDLGSNTPSPGPSLGGQLGSSGLAAVR